MALIDKISIEYIPYQSLSDQSGTNLRGYSGVPPEATYGITIAAGVEIIKTEDIAKLQSAVIRFNTAQPGGVLALAVAPASQDVYVHYTEDSSEIVISPPSTTVLNILAADSYTTSLAVNATLSLETPEGTIWDAGKSLYLTSASLSGDTAPTHRHAVEASASWIELGV